MMRQVVLLTIVLAGALAFQGCQREEVYRKVSVKDRELIRLESDASPILTRFASADNGEKFLCETSPLGIYENRDGFVFVMFAICGDVAGDQGFSGPQPFRVTKRSDGSWKLKGYVEGSSVTPYPDDVVPSAAKDDLSRARSRGDLDPVVDRLRLRQNEAEKSG